MLKDLRIGILWLMARSAILTGLLENGSLPETLGALRSCSYQTEFVRSPEALIGSANRNFAYHYPQIRSPRTMETLDASPAQLEAFRQFLLNQRSEPQVSNYISEELSAVSPKSSELSKAHTGGGVTGPSTRVQKKFLGGKSGKTPQRKAIKTQQKRAKIIREPSPAPFCPEDQQSAGLSNNPPLSGNSTVLQSEPKSSIFVQDDNDIDFGMGDFGSSQQEKKFVIGLDYGTTFTSVSYYAFPANEDHPRAFPADIKSIVNWPEDGMGGMRRQIPTESWYSAKPMLRGLCVDQFELSESEEAEDEEEPNIEAQHTSVIFNGVPIDPTLEEGEMEKYLWGYEVPYQRYRTNTIRDERLHVERPKLMLVNSKFTLEDRTRLQPCLDHLIKNGIIRKYGKRDLTAHDVRDVQDTITDFLIEVFLHTKQQLEEIEGLTEDSQVAFALTVPVIWSSRASRVLQYAVEAAIKATGFGTMKNGSVDNLFLVPEPEAAATYLLGSSHDMLAGETFVVLDCGGGTVDGVTYTVTNGYPLRLKREVGRPSGDNCGASYLNDNFEKRLLDRLADEKYLDRNGETRETIVRHLIPSFEDFDKRSKDVTKRPGGSYRIPGLLGDQQRKLTGQPLKRFTNNFIQFNSEDYKEIFMPLLRRIGVILRQQIDGALAKEKPVKRVFLIGGFGAAPSLRSYLREYLATFVDERKLSYEIDLITTNEQDSVTAVASGAVLRALNLEQGPERTAISSYGFLRIEPYQPSVEGREGHLEATPTTDPFDGLPYVKVIDYFMLRGEPVLPQHFYNPFQTTHAFEVDAPRFLCEEVLYVNDGNITASHYELGHPRNQGAQVTGKIIVDMTSLRERGTILPTFPTPDEDGITRGKIHYEVTYDLVPIVEGRNLRYEARYPADAGAGAVQKVGQISIAAAFLPGTG